MSPSIGHTFTFKLRRVLDSGIPIPVLGQPTFQFRLGGAWKACCSGPVCHFVPTFAGASAAAPAVTPTSSRHKSMQCSELGMVAIPLVVKLYSAWDKEAQQCFSHLASRLAVYTSIMLQVQSHIRFLKSSEPCSGTILCPTTCKSLLMKSLEQRRADRTGYLPDCVLFF